MPVPSAILRKIGSGPIHDCGTPNSRFRRKTAPGKPSTHKRRLLPVRLAIRHDTASNPCEMCQTLNSNAHSKNRASDPKDAQKYWQFDQLCNIQPEVLAFHVFGPHKSKPSVRGVDRCALGGRVWLATIDNSGHLLH